MISGQITGVENLLRTLAVVAEGAEDIHAPLEAGAKILSDSVLTNFVSGGRPDAWQDILPESRAQRKFDGGTPPLWDSGALATAATALRDGVPGSGYARTASSITFGVGDPDFHGARRHQNGFGTDRLGRTFHEPARKFLMIQTSDGPKVLEVFDMYLVKLLAGGK